MTSNLMGAQPRHKLWQRFFMLAALEAGAAFVALASVPREGSGLSLSRIIMFAMLGACLAATGYAAARPPHTLDRLVTDGWAAAGAATAVIVGAALFLLRYLQPEQALPYYQRLGPLLWFALLLSLQLAVIILIARHGIRPAALRTEATLWRAAVVAFAALMLIFVFVAVSRIGLTPDSAYWAEPGVPVLAWQLGIALLVGAGAFLLSRRLDGAARTHVVLAAGVWLLAVALWMSVPASVMKSSFYGPINPPSNQTLPNSDAGYYDSMAHSLLIGYPYQGDIPTRPLYITLLAALHLLVGERYDLIIAGQTLLLAFIPVTIYLLGARLHSRAAGLIAALFAVFREWNSLLISSQTRVSNTKTLLVDLPTLLLLLAATLFTVRWLQRRGRIDAVLAGGVLGLLLLLRTQTLLLVPAVLLMALLAYGFRNRQWAAPFGFFALGLLAALLPWLIHNYLYTGQITLDAPFEYQVIASQYKYTGNLDLGSVDLQGKGVLGLLLTFALKDPKFVAGFVASHFLATLVDSALALPLAAHYNGLLAPLNLYWMSWPEGLDALNAVLLVPYLAVIALGLGAAWKRLQWIGLVPLACALAYAAANGIGRFSGWRYDLPADWVAYFYLALGVAEAMRLIALLFGWQHTKPEDDIIAGPARSAGWQRMGFALAALAFFGALPWMAEGIALPRYAADTLPALVDTLVSSPSVQQLGVNQTQIEHLMTDPQATLQIGRVLYPRYFSRGKGLSSAHPWPAYAVRDFPRMGFLLLNQSRHEALMQLSDSSADFWQGSDAIILGCQRADYIDVRLILFPETGRAYTSGPLDQGCK